MLVNPTYTLINPQTKALAFKIVSFEDNTHFDQLQRLNYYSLLLLQKGNGTLKADFSEYTFEAPNLLCFSPYQPFMLKEKESISGVALHFHPDFFCIHKHQKEVACNGVLFNNIYDPPLLNLTGEESSSLLLQVWQMKNELERAQLAQSELLLSYLKIFLISAARIKATQNPAAREALENNHEPFILQKLKDAIEDHYRTKHSASDYAKMLHISPKALARIAKTHLNKTLTHLISERIVIEAKRELYLTSKGVKEIAYELGFGDEYYFSRFFKNNADVSPQAFRQTVGFARAEGG